MAYCSEWNNGALDPKLELTDNRLCKHQFRYSVIQTICTVVN